MAIAKTYKQVPSNVQAFEDVANALRQMNDNLVGRMPDMHPELYWVMTQDFNGAVGSTLPTPWYTASLAGTAAGAYLASEPAGAYQIALAAAEHAGAGEAVYLSHGNHYLISADKEPVVDFVVRVDAIDKLTSVEKVIIGLSSQIVAPETDPDSATYGCWFMFNDGDAKIYVESDDNTTNNDDKDSGLVLVDDTWTHFRIDMGNLSDVKMYVNGVQQGAGIISMPDVSGQVLQPAVRMWRLNDTGTEAAVQTEVDYIRIMARR